MTTLQDLSPFGNDGTFNGGMTLDNIVPGPVPGMMALSFTPPQEYVALSSIPDLPVATVSGWFKPNVLTGPSAFGTVFAASVDGFQIRLNNVGAFNVLSRASLWTTLNAVHTLVVNEWVYLTAIQGTSTLELYVNGQFDGSTSRTGTPVAATSGYLLGIHANLGTSNDLDGCLADWRFYNRELSSQEISNLYEQSLLNYPAQVTYPIGGRQTEVVEEVAVTGYTLAVDSGAFSVAGTATSLEVGYVVVAASGAYAWTGTAAELNKGQTLATASGTFVVTGTAASLEVGYLVAATSGSYTVDGTAASLTIGYNLVSASGAYVVTGTAASLEIGYLLSTASGPYVVTGTAVDLIPPGVSLVADSGTFSVAGTATTLLIGYSLGTTSGSYVVTGTDVSLIPPGTTLEAASGAFTVTGTNTALVVGRALAGDSGAYIVSGTATTLLATHTLPTASGTYAVTGTATGLGIGYTVDAATESFTVTGTATSHKIGYAVDVASGAFVVTGTNATLTYAPSGSINDYVLVDNVLGALTSCSLIGSNSSSALVKKP